MYELATTPKPDVVWNDTYNSDMGIPLQNQLQTSMSETEYGAKGLGKCECGGKCGMTGLGGCPCGMGDATSWLSDMLPDGHGILDLVVYGVAGYAILSAFGAFRSKAQQSGKRLKSARASYEKARSEAGIFGGLFG